MSLCETRPRRTSAATSLRPMLGTLLSRPSSRARRGERKHTRGDDTTLSGATDATVSLARHTCVRSRTKSNQQSSLARPHAADLSLSNTNPSQPKPTQTDLVSVVEVVRHARRRVDRGRRVVEEERLGHGRAAAVLALFAAVRCGMLLDHGDGARAEDLGRVLAVRVVVLVAYRK